MLPRQSIVEIFSTFIQFNSDRFSSWATDPKLRRSMKQSLTQMSDRDTSENFWVIYWHKIWQAQPKGMARDHLSAYLQEVCYWATHKTITGFTTTQYTISDCFQVAIARIDKILKGFNPNQGFSLKNYASITFSNLIRELLRQKQEIDICSDWALLRKISQKRLTEALQQAAVPNEIVDRYILAWNNFKIIYVPDRPGITRKLSKPEPETWAAIVKEYNSNRHAQLSNPGPEISAETIEKWMLSCVKAARSYLYPSVASINVPKPGQDSGEIADNLTSEDIDNSLIDGLIAEEEQQTRNTNLHQISQVLIEAIALLDPQMQKLLELYYARGLTQQEMAEELGTKQYTVCRRLSKARESLLKALIEWSQKTLHISLSSDVIKSTSAILEEWLAGYYRRSEI